MSAWTNHWSPGRQIYRWSPRSCKERQGKPPSTNSNRGVPQDRRWRTNSAHPCENPLIHVAQENLYYRVVVAVAAPCISWGNNSANAHWLIIFVSERDCAIRLSIFFVTICTVRENSRINVNYYDTLKASNAHDSWKRSAFYIYNFIYIVLIFA